ncbi:hypothetical protein Hanom_Chr06g00558271 [Helianthus anomalus]
MPADGYRRWRGRRSSEQMQFGDKWRQVIVTCELKYHAIQVIQWTRIPRTTSQLFIIIIIIFFFFLVFG